MTDQKKLINLLNGIRIKVIDGDDVDKFALEEAIRLAVKSEMQYDLLLYSQQVLIEFIQERVIDEDRPDWSVFSEDRFRNSNADEILMVALEKAVGLMAKEKKE